MQLHNSICGVGVRAQYLAPKKERSTYFIYARYAFVAVTPEFIYSSKFGLKMCASKMYSGRSFAIDSFSGNLTANKLPVLFVHSRLLDVSLSMQPICSALSIRFQALYEFGIWRIRRKICESIDKKLELDQLSE